MKTIVLKYYNYSLTTLIFITLYGNINLQKLKRSAINKNIENQNVHSSLLLINLFVNSKTLLVKQKFMTE